MGNNIEQLKINKRVTDNGDNLLGKIIIPFFVFISFIWLNLYSTVTGINSFPFLLGEYSSVASKVVFTILIAGIVDYVIFELSFFIYRLFISFSIYSYMIPKNVLLNKFRIWYLIRNLVLGVILNLRFFFPYINTYLCVFELILNFAFIICLYFDLYRNHVERLVGQFVFKTLLIPVVLYEVYVVIGLMVGVL